MRRLSAVFALLGACLLMTLVIPGMASAVPPERVENVTFDPNVTELDPDLTAACGFRVTSTAKGHFRAAIFFDKAGEVTRVVAHPSFTQTLTSPFGSITTSDRGMDRTTLNADGTLTIFGTGIHLKIKGGSFAIGRWILVVDPDTGSLISADYNGRFDVLAPDIIGELCRLLGPR